MVDSSLDSYNEGRVAALFDYLLTANIGARYFSCGGIISQCRSDVSQANALPKELEDLISSSAALTRSLEMLTSQGKLSKTNVRLSSANDALNLEDIYTISRPSPIIPSETSEDESSN